VNTTERTFFIKRALLLALEECGEKPVQESALRMSIEVKVDFLEPTTAEIDTVLRAIDRDRLCVSLPSERGPKYRLTDAGRLWLAENSA
jgi:DNA-binding PadR family transcriptional regulator